MKGVDIDKIYIDDFLDDTVKSMLDEHRNKISFKDNFLPFKININYWSNITLIETEVSKIKYSHLGIDLRW